jgi:hypothetical protein
LVVEAPSVENRQEASNTGDAILDSALVFSDSEFANLGEDFLDWNDSDMNFTDFLNPQTYGQTAQYPVSRSSSFVQYLTPSTDHILQVQQVISSSKVSIPPLPSYSIRSLVQRPKGSMGEQKIANLILHTLKSYPLMMLRHSTLPPFIHPHLISANVKNNHMEPLTNCISLVRMISSGIQGSRKLFWKNVQLECERLCDQVR